VCGLEESRRKPRLQGSSAGVPCGASGFLGFNCKTSNSSARAGGDGANWQSAEFKDRRGHTCAYHGTAFTTARPDACGFRPSSTFTNPDHAMPTGYLTSISMLDPWESLKVKRATAAAGLQTTPTNGAGGPEVDIYDVSGDCRTPQLLRRRSRSATGRGWRRCHAGDRPTRAAGHPTD